MLPLWIRAVTVLQRYGVSSKRSILKRLNSDTLCLLRPAWLAAQTETVSFMLFTLNQVTYGFEIYRRINIVSPLWRSDYDPDVSP